MRFRIQATQAALGLLLSAMGVAVAQEATVVPAVEAPSVLATNPMPTSAAPATDDTGACTTGDCYGTGVHWAGGAGLQRVGQVATLPVRPAVGTGDCTYRQYGPHDLFRQYYVPNNCGGAPAELYPAPHAVPPHVGHVYYTYQPLYPHEWLYKHHRTYHRYYNDGRGLTRTSVRWW